MIKILEKKVMRGANIYSYRPVIVMTIHLGEYDEVPTSQLDGFVDKLLEMVHINVILVYGEIGALFQPLICATV